MWVKKNYDLLDSGRTIFTDNWYTSVSLSEKLLVRKVDTLRSNRKCNPSEVTNAKLQRSNIIAKQNIEKRIVLNWRTKEISSCLAPNMMTTFRSKDKKNNQTQCDNWLYKVQSFIDTLYKTYCEMV